MTEQIEGLLLNKKRGRLWGSSDTGSYIAEVIRIEPEMVQV